MDVSPDNKQPFLPAGPSGADDDAARETRLGLLAALGAYGAWGILGIYYAALAHVPAIEVVSHRVAWSIVMMGLFFLLRGRWGEVWATIKNRQTFLVLLGTSVLISINWMTYIWSVSNGHATEASLGYFIVPLINVALGYLLLSEKLSRMQMVAIGFAIAAILLQLVLLGSLPVVSLIVSFTFGAYGYLRKIVPVGANLGLMVELVLISPFAVGYILFVQTTGEGSLSFSDMQTTLLLVFTGVITYLPLMWFSAAAKRLQLSTVGIMQYLNPTLQFFVAVFFLKEELSSGKLATFVLIWLSVLIYSYDVFVSSRRKRQNRTNAVV